MKEIITIENLLKKINTIKNKEKSLRISIDTLDTIKGVSYGIGEGKQSAKFITGNQALESAVIKKDEIQQKINGLAKLIDDMMSSIEDLKNERNGEELFRIIKNYYIENKSTGYIQDTMNISSSTLHRRKMQALEKLKEKGFHNLNQRMKLIWV